MAYKSTAELVTDLEKKGLLIKVKEEVDPNLQMALIHKRVFKKQGPALFFENIKGCKFSAVSNLYGTEERCDYIFKETLSKCIDLIQIKSDPALLLKHPRRYLPSMMHAFKSLTKKTSSSNIDKFQRCSISDLPPIKSWPNDGGAFVTLPLVYTEHPEMKGAMRSNLGMYRIQLNGNEYLQDEEVGLHYQLHRGIGVHQTIAQARGEALKVSVFVGGPPALTWAAIMPLPEDIAEVSFAGLLGDRRFRYFDYEGFTIAEDADFVICGTIKSGVNKPEGPFGDHLGYYSLQHDFPVLEVEHVLHKPDAIWPFTIVGRPPQEDSMFGKLIHRITSDALKAEIKGLKAVNAVDESGVHPLLLAIGSERYTPYQQDARPSELLTIANHILGTGQLSLAKYLLILNDADVPELDIANVRQFLIEILRRFDPVRDLHFQTKTSIDTLDYSGDGLNEGSKLIIAARGGARRNLHKEIGSLALNTGSRFRSPKVVCDGILALQGEAFESYANAKNDLAHLCDSLKEISEALLEAFPLIVIVDDVDFISKDFSNFLWVTFTRSNPAADLYGVGSFYKDKHWSSEGSLVIDARKKHFHAPELIEDRAVEESLESFFESGSPLKNYL